jgi:flagellar hook protein FlgE
MGFAQGVSGLNSSAANLDVIGNNIANSGTIGFKSGGVQFADVYAGSRVGMGTQVSGVAQNFTAGSVQGSGRALDVAITNGDGFFRLANDSGELIFSRNGQFNMDKEGYLVNAAGLKLTGYPVGTNGTIAGGGLTALQLPTKEAAPNPTTKVNAQFNFDSRSVAPVDAFDADNSETYNYSSSINVYDSLGNAHELSTFFAKEVAPAINTWNVYAAADGNPLTSTGAMAVAVAPAKPVAGSLGQLVFDANGKLTATPATLTVAGLNFGNGSNDMGFTVDITGTTQFGNANAVNKLNQDGYTSGVLTSYAIGPDGTITGKYSNEQSKALGQIVLSSFLNPNGLQPKGDNGWTETSASGQPLTGTPGSGTKLGALTSGALEASNVDLTAELVNLIIAQRTYQANSQTVKTQDQVMQSLINLR